MMYSEKIAAAIKVNGKTLREDKDKVMIPFGSEYTILYKNMNSVRTIFTVHVDGEDAVGRVICEPNSTVELERFVKDNLDTGNRFKFIERTAQVEQYRGTRVDDGLIRIESWKERKPEPIRLDPYEPYYEPPYPPYQPWPWDRRRRPYPPSSPRRSIHGSAVGSADSGPSYFNSSSFCIPSMGSGSTPTSLNDVGVTVAGSQSDQQFVHVSGFPTETTSSVLVFHLVGRVGKTQVSQPVTVSKVKCDTCGTTNRSSSQFCGKCGTSLVIYR